MNIKYLTTEEAFHQIQDGISIVSTGGYTFSKHHYFAYGTYPECLRDGDSHTLEGMKSIGDKWFMFTDKDIVLKCGWRSPQYKHPIREDGTGHFDSLTKFLEDNLTVSDYNNPIKNAKMVTKFFEGDEL